MADTSDRLAQFRKMAEADPDNELGHFSLGRALLDAGQAAEAATSLRRAIQINPNIAKVYQLLAQAELKLGNKDAAIQALTQGIHAGDRHGDRVPREEMAAVLEELGAPVPPRPKVAGPTVGEGQVQCRRCGKAGPQLAKPPFKSDFGQQVYAHICQPCWTAAIGMGTKVINELRLPMHDPQAQKMWDQHIREFLNLT